MEGIIAEVRLFGGIFAPRGWAFCDGSILSIAQNTAVFSLLGTTYGGDGITTFALPDLRGAVVVGAGSGPGVNPVDLGETGTTGGAASGLGTLGLNYIICLEGIFPSRS